MSRNFLRSRNVLRENSDNTAPQVDERNNSSVQRGKRKTSSCSSQSPRKRRRTEEEKEREEEEQQVLTTSAESEEQERSSCESARSVSSEDVSSEEQSSATVSEAEESRFLADGLEEKYVQQERLGEGGFGSVYAGYRRDDRLLVAIKHIPIYKVKRTTVVVDGEEKDWPLEVALMEMASEAGGVPVALLDWYELQDELVIVMERPVPCMDLMDYLQSKGGCLEEEEAKVILRQLVEGMISIHSNRVLHRDIKPENILVQTDPEGPRARVLDFGCGCFIQEKPYRSFCGTPDFRPPEWLLQGSYEAEPCTVWQIGVTLYIMLTGSYPFDSPKEIISDYPFLPGHLSQESEDLLQSFLEKQPLRRPSLQCLLQHPWLQ